MAYSRLRNAITREKLRLFVRFATYKQESSDKYPFLVKVRLMVLRAPLHPLLSIELGGGISKPTRIER